MGTKYCNFMVTLCVTLWSLNSFIPDDCIWQMPGAVTFEQNCRVLNRDSRMKSCRLHHGMKGFIVTLPHQVNVSPFCVICDDHVTLWTLNFAAKPLGDIGLISDTHNYVVKPCVRNKQLLFQYFIVVFNVGCVGIEQLCTCSGKGPDTHLSPNRISFYSHSNRNFQRPGISHHQLPTSAFCSGYELNLIHICKKHGLVVQILAPWASGRVLGLSLTRANR